MREPLHFALTRCRHSSWQAKARRNNQPQLTEWAGEDSFAGDYRPGRPQRVRWNRLVRKLVEDGAELDVLDTNGLSAIDYALGRFPKEFNALAPEPYPETVALLRSLGATRENPGASFAPGTTPKIQALVPTLSPAATTSAITAIVPQ